MSPRLSDICGAEVEEAKQLRGCVPGPQGPCRRWAHPRPVKSRTLANRSVYVGTALRSLASQLRHHAGVTGFAAALSADVARSPDHDLFDLLPTSRSTIGYRYDWTTYVIHPNVSFTLEYRGRVSSLPAGVRASGHDAEARRRPPGVLPPVLPERLGEAGQRRVAAPGALRLRVFRQRERLPRRRRRCEGGTHHYLQRRDHCRAWHPGRHMDSSAAPFLRQEAAVLPGPGCTMTSTPFRPLPVGAVPAWLLGPFFDNLQPLMPLTPSRLQFGADLIRQGKPRPTQFFIALQLWLVATPASPRTLPNRPMGVKHVPPPAPIRSYDFL